MAFGLCAPLDHCVLDSMLLLQYYGLSCMYVCMYVCMYLCMYVFMCLSVMKSLYTMQGAGSLVVPRNGDILVPGAPVVSY